MKIVVPVKYVPEPTAIWSFGADNILDRTAVEGHLSELDEYAVEQAVRLVEGGLDAEVVAITVGPEKASDALRKAMAMGVAAGVHVLDDAIRGSDALATSLVLARAIEQTGFDLIVCGMASTDAELSVVPSMIAARLSIPQATFANALNLTDGVVTIRRDGDSAVEEVAASLPALVSITDQSGEPRYPVFKAIMASRKKPIQTLSLSDLGISPADVGLAASATTVLSIVPCPPRSTGTVVVDEGDSAVQLADFLVSRGFL